MVRILEKNGYELVKEEFGAEEDPYGNGMLLYKKILWLSDSNKTYV